MPERQRFESPRRRSSFQKPYNRREFLGLSGKTLLIAGGAVVLGGGAAAFWRISNSESDVDKLLADYRDKEKKLEPVIINFEKGFGQFSQVLRHKATVANVPTQGRRSLEYPLEIAEINLQNTKRNVYTFKRQDLEARRSRKTSYAQLSDPNFFFFGLLENEAGSLAAFEPPTKTFYIGSAYNPDNVLDNLIAFHELVHIAQDNLDRQELPSDRYRAFFEEAQRRKVIKAVALYEATAYMEEVYALDLLTDGQFKRDVLSGVISLPKYRALLRTCPEQDSVIVFLGNLGYQVFSGRSNWEVIDAKFVDYVKNIYRQNRVEVYDRTPFGFVLSK